MRTYAFARTHSYALVRTHSFHALHSKNISLMNSVSLAVNTMLQAKWAESISADEVIPWEIKNLCNLIDAIFVETVSYQVEKLRTEKCCGCLVDHPSQRRHDCLMMTERESWETHELEAIERAIEQNLVWKQLYLSKEFAS